MSRILLAIVMFITVNIPAYADCYTTDFSHRLECERFSLFGDPSQTAHFWGSAVSTVVGSMVFKKMGMKPIPATLTALGLTMILGAAKETLVDDYMSRNGILSGWAGGLAGACAVTILEF